jgi:serine/threonine protein kinase
MMDKLVGQVLGGKYLIQASLGEGGMGQVYLAEQQGLKRRVAVKVLRDALMTEPRVVARFEREAAAAARISHPNSVTVFDFGRDERGLLFLAMEYLEGESLSQRLKRQRRLSPESSIAILSQLLGPLAACHSAGVIHRDLKPDNIFLSLQNGREQVKLLDYGVARVADSPEVTKSGQIVGTPVYMAPEQISGKTVGPATDFYAFGVILFELLTGRPPFMERSHIELFRQHMTATVPRLAEVLSGRDDLAPFDAVLARLLAKRPEDRYHSTDAVRVGLEEALRVYRKRVGALPLEETVQDPALIEAHADTLTANAYEEHPLVDSSDETAKMPPLGGTMDLNSPMKITPPESNRGRATNPQRPGLGNAPDSHPPVNATPVQIPRNPPDPGASGIPTSVHSPRKMPALVLPESAVPVVSAPAPSLIKRPQGEAQSPVTPALPGAVVGADPSKEERAPATPSPERSSAPSTNGAAALAVPPPALSRSGTASKVSSSGSSPKVFSSSGSLAALRPPIPDAGETRWLYVIAAVLALGALVLLLWPVPAPRAAGVWIRSEPAGATVKLNGSPLSGETPLRTPINAAEAEIELSRPGCEGVKKTVPVSPDTAQLFFLLSGESCR